MDGILDEREAEQDAKERAEAAAARQACAEAKKQERQKDAQWKAEKARQAKAQAEEARQARADELKAKQTQGAGTRAVKKDWQKQAADNEKARVNKNKLERKEIQDTRTAGAQNRKEMLERRAEAARKERANDHIARDNKVCLEHHAATGFALGPVLASRHHLVPVMSMPARTGADRRREPAGARAREGASGC